MKRYIRTRVLGFQGSPPARGRGLKLRYINRMENGVCRPPRGGVD